MKSRAVLLVVMAPLLVALAACGKDDKAHVASADGGSTTLAHATTSQAAHAGSGATTTHRVAKGDSLWAISEQFCTTAPAIAKANGWSDGIHHAIFPGDVIAVPQVPCTTTTLARPGSTTTRPTQATTPVTVGPAKVTAWLAQKQTVGFVPDPLYGDPADYYEGFGDVCQEAWGKTYEFEKLGLGKPDVLKALAPLPGTTPAAVLASIDRWAAFTAQWYLRYTDVIARYKDSDGNVDYDRAITDKDYRAFLAAYLPVAADQTAAHDYATKTCAAILSTKGSTP